MFDYSELPSHMQGAVRRYVEHGISPGSFLEAVLSNNLMQAVERADHINLQALPVYAMFLYNEVPTGCYGSPEAFREWVSQGGLEKGPQA